MLEMAGDGSEKHFYQGCDKRKLMGPNLTQAEGQVFGIGCKIFAIAGPVILYGIFTSWVPGLGYWIGKMMGI